MATIKSFTDLSQSKKLAEILPLESADMCYILHASSDNPDWRFDDDIPPMVLGKTPINKLTVKALPCWSLAALINLLPSKFTEKGKHSETTYSIKIRKYALTEDVDIYQIAYGNYRWHEDESCSWSDMINTGEKENLIDAVFQMICWLKENNKL